MLTETGCRTTGLLFNVRVLYQRYMGCLVLCADDRGRTCMSVATMYTFYLNRRSNFDYTRNSLAD